MAALLVGAAIVALAFGVTAYFDGKRRAMKMWEACEEEPWSSEYQDANTIWHTIPKHEEN